MYFEGEWFGLYIYLKFSLFYQETKVFNLDTEKLLLFDFRINGFTMWEFIFQNIFKQICKVLMEN